MGVMVKRRDRHQRGLRGPLAITGSLTDVPAPVLRRVPSADYFDSCVAEAVRRITRACPQAIAGIKVGVEEVPLLAPSWDSRRVPLAAALERTEEQPGQVVVYRRPLERRAANRRGLAILVHRTVVEQLSALTGLTVDEIDPEGWSEEDED